MQRQKFSAHKAWQAHLERAGEESPLIERVIAQSEIPPDTQSASFRARMLQSTATGPTASAAGVLAAQNCVPVGFSQYEVRRALLSAVLMQINTRGHWRDARWIRNGLGSTPRVHYG